jgi:hypothetical protein
MHRQVLNARRGVKVDHRSGDGLDNRRGNLRVATTGQNNCNVQRRKDCTSGYKGASWHARIGLWQSQIQVAGRKRCLGYHNTAEEAARAYDVAARELHGEFACLNFPESK